MRVGVVVSGKTLDVLSLKRKGVGQTAPVAEYTQSPEFSSQFSWLRPRIPALRKKTQEN